MSNLLKLDDKVKVFNLMHKIRVQFKAVFEKEMKAKGLSVDFPED